MPKNWVFLPQNKGHISNKSQTYFYVDVLAHRMPCHTLLKLKCMEIRKYKLFPEIREKMSKNYVFAPN